MICKNCGAEFGNDMSFCPNCGAAAQTYNTYQQNEPYTMPNYSAYDYNNQYQQPVKNTEVSVGKYICWSLLAYAFGPISFVISIVFACMNEDKNRANFFRAQLVMWVVLIVLLIILITVISLMFGFTLANNAVVDSFATYEFYDEFLKIVALIKI